MCYSWIWRCVTKLCEYTFIGCLQVRFQCSFDSVDETLVIRRCLLLDTIIVREFDTVFYTVFAYSPHSADIGHQRLPNQNLCTRLITTDTAAIPGGQAWFSTYSIISSYFGEYMYCRKTNCPYLEQSHREISWIVLTLTRKQFEWKKLIMWCGYWLFY